MRFVRRFWRVVHDAPRSRSPAGVDTPLARKAHETVSRVTDDIERRFVFNTPIAAVMELVNELSKAPDDPAARFAAETAVSMLQPYAPHVCEELWACSQVAALGFAVAGCRRVVARAGGDRARAAGERQGARPRARSGGLSKDELIARARASEKVQAHVNGGSEQRVIVVPDKLVNIVV